jgi:hypothetical protein
MTFFFFFKVLALQIRLELDILLPQSPKYWDCRHAPPSPARLTLQVGISKQVGIETQTLHFKLRKHKQKLKAPLNRLLLFGLFKKEERLGHCEAMRPCAKLRLCAKPHVTSQRAPW